MKRLKAIRVDGFLLALAATVGLAALLPAHGSAADAVSIAAKAAIALLFFLSPDSEAAIEPAVGEQP